MPRITGILDLIKVANRNAANANTALGLAQSAKSGVVTGLTVGAAGTALTSIRKGRATLVAGAVVVADVNVLTTTNIQVSRYTVGGTPGNLNTATRTAGTSFTITSSSALETSVIDWIAFD
ncbi:MAG: hypothetical protein EBR82_57360 [Caulobacteraceae bacterium]|nr:hypothetical protein [Caulobacteraceae bacterium]